MGKKCSESIALYKNIFSSTVRTKEGFVVPDVGTCIEVTKRVLNAKVSPDRIFDCETFDGIVVGIYPYQIAVHRIDAAGTPMRGENSIVYLRTQEIHMLNKKGYRKQIVQAISEIPDRRLFEKTEISSDDIMEYLKLIPHRVFGGYEVGDYVACEEIAQNCRKAKRYILKIEDKRDNIMVGMEIRYGKPNMLRYILALQLESGQMRIKKVSEHVALFAHTYDELALEVL